MAIWPLPSLTNMRHDLAEFLPEQNRRQKVATWLRFYFKPTRRWIDRLVTWNDLRRFGPLPPIEKDRVAQHFGFAGHAPCTDGPVCAEHGWELSPMVKED